MNTPSHALDVDVLVEQVAPMRRLARRLVWQDADADDLVQGAALTALESGARAQQPVAWLRGVVRVLARKRSSTAARHERLAQRLPAPGAAPSPAQVLETLELQKRLASLLIDLGEPYRTALHMRYFQDRPPREIASVLGLPVHTVKTHLSRGLERLRSRLDAEHGGRRRAWQTALAPLAGLRPEAVAAATAAGAAPALAGPVAWVPLAAAVLLLGWGTWFVLGDGGRADEGLPETADAPADVGEGAAPRGAARLAGRAPTDRPDATAPADGGPVPRDANAAAPLSPGAAAAPSGIAPAPIDLLAEVRDAGGNLLPDVLVDVHRNRYLGQREDTRLAHGRSDARGAVRLVVPIPSADSYGRHVVVAARRDGQPATAQEIELREGVLNRVALSLHAPLELTVRVSDQDGAPLGGATCAACFGSKVAYRTPDGAEVAATTDEAGLAVLLVPDRGGEGRFALGGAAGFVVRARHPAFVDAFSAPLHGADSRRLEVSIVAARARPVVVRVLTEDDAPVARQTFLVTVRRETAAGTEPIGPPWAVETDAAGMLRIERAPRHAFVLALRSGTHAPADVPIEPGAHDAIARVARLAGLAFRLVDGSDDEPAVVQFAMVATWPAGRQVVGAVRRTERDRIEVGGLAPGDYTLRVWLEGRWGAHAHRFRMEAQDGADGVVEVPAAPGRVVGIQARTADDRPIAGATCHLGAETQLDLSTDPPFPIGSCVRVRTDATGRARAAGLPPGAYRLHVRAPGGRTAVASLTIDEGEGKPIAVVARIETPSVLQLPVPEAYARAGLAFRPQVIDADGTRHFPATQVPGEAPALASQEVRAGTVTVIPETASFETAAFPRDPYAVTLELSAGEVRAPNWPPLDPVRATIVVRDADGSAFGGRWCSLLRVGPGQGEEVAGRHRFLGRKRFLLDEEGTYVAQGLLPGRYVLVISGKDLRMHAFEVSTDSEQTVRLPR